MIKRLTFVRRAPGVEAEEFAASWEQWAIEVDQAARDGGSLHRLVHCVVRPGRTDRPHHGVAIAWFDDEAALSAHDLSRAESGWGPVDGSAVVDVRVNTRTVDGQDLLDEWWHDPDGDSKPLMFGIVQRRPGMSREDFADYWWNEHRPLANQVVPSELQPPIYVHNYAMPGEESEWDGAAEFYDEPVDVVRARGQWIDTPEGAQIVVDEGKFLNRDTRAALLTQASVVISS